MATTTLQTKVKGANGKWKEVASTVNITHNNARLVFHSDGNTYEYIGNDASGNRIYRDTRKVR